MIDLDVHLFSSLNIFKICSESDSFKSWLKNYHDISDFDNIFFGYQYFLDVCAVRIIEEVEDASDSLNIELDEVAYNASSHGINLEDIPNTCECIILLKNIWRILKPIRLASDWFDLDEVLFRTKDLISDFNSIFQYNKSEKVTLERFLSSVVGEYAHIYFNDTERGEPLGGRLGTVPPILQYSPEKIFPGYVLTLQYLWYNLLGKNRFEKSVLKNIHLENVGRDKEEAESIIQDYYLDGDLSDDAGDSLWILLDSYFGEVYTQIVEPNSVPDIEDKYLTIKPNAKELLASYLDRTTVENPKYLLDETSSEALSKKIDYHFLWLPFAYLDLRKSWDFTGVMAFVPFMFGLINSPNVKKRKVDVLRIRHPHAGRKGYFFSYAILNEGDYFGGPGFGWVVFPVCATDFSGHGGYMHALAENWIEKAKNEGKINVRQFDVGEECFLNYLLDRSVDSDSRDIMAYINQEESEEKYDVGLSFAWEDKDIVGEYAKILERHGLKVYMASNSPDQIWGEYLKIHLNLIFKSKVDWFVPFFSNDYPKKKWTMYELQIALQRQKEEGRRKFILPIKMDDVNIPGISQDLVYMHIKETMPDKICKYIVDNVKDGIKFNFPDQSETLWKKQLK